MNKGRPQHAMPDDQASGGVVEAAATAAPAVEAGPLGEGLLNLLASHAQCCILDLQAAGSD